MGGQFRPLLVAGVAGGVGTSTWARCVRLASGLPVEDLGVYRGGLVDVLVTSNTAAATSKLGPALAACARPPVLIVMHILPGVVAESRSHLRKADPHIAARFDIAHHRNWCEMESPPGRRLSPKARDVIEALRRFPAALHTMYAPPAKSSTPAQLPRPESATVPARTTSWVGPTPHFPSSFPGQPPPIHRR